MHAHALREMHVRKAKIDTDTDTDLVVVSVHPLVTKAFVAQHQLQKDAASAPNIRLVSVI